MYLIWIEYTDIAMYFQVAYTAPQLDTINTPDFKGALYMNSL